MQAPVIAELVRHHAEEVAFLYIPRQVLIAAPHVQLFELSRMDERIAAHLDGVAVAGEAGWDICDELLLEPSAGEVFLVAARALNTGEIGRLEALFALLSGEAGLQRGLLSAFGWVQPKYLRGVAAQLLLSTEPLRRFVGVAACSMHRVDSGLLQSVDDAVPVVRARALRAAGELGKRELLISALKALQDEDLTCRHWAAWSAVLLSGGQGVLDRLSELALQPGLEQWRLLQLMLQAASVTRAHALLQSQPADAGGIMARIRGAGYVGDPNYVPWLISYMADQQFSRTAGESFSMITGVNLFQPPFFGNRPDELESDPNEEEDPEDDEINLDLDDNLPWPNQPAIKAWWDQHGARFTTGIRHFLGQPPSREHCIKVLKTGYQRQRIAAAYHLCLLNPGAPLFEWRAPAWRQQRELARIS
jgi:uncharacterized protein (TIGR02270 family)